MVEQILNWMKQIEIGEGDLTTESIALYPFHSSGRLVMSSDALFSGRAIMEKLLESAGEQLQVEWSCNEGDEIPAGATIFNFNGNGAEILKIRRLLEWLAGSLSGLATATHETVKFLGSHNKKLVAGNSVSPIFEEFEKLAFTTGGGEMSNIGISERMYLTRNHFIYVGKPPAEIMTALSDELGSARKKVKIEVEVNDPFQFEEINQLDCDVIHLVDFNEDQLRTVFENLNPSHKTVVHLLTLSDYRPEYDNYFFKYVAIEALHRTRHYLPARLIFSKD
ncbi:MAG TPA: hypothetical protein P5268_06390 [Candidatus Marinimicrobia bacterium]|nr:hypothetical protein [Candidatus Neomarinimicrobiota bacterium]HRS51808.1 hypothetical protein [Candidatus Neomarinimicrobiota bacterium]HRU92640.1 hypothetical protein [Candidatus Neomarinimicrobiota bacterium]